MTSVPNRGTSGKEARVSRMSKERCSQFAVVFVYNMWDDSEVYGQMIGGMGAKITVIVTHVGRADLQGICINGPPGF